MHTVRHKDVPATDYVAKGFLKPADDLSQLKMIDAQKVREFLGDINSLKPGDLAHRKLTIVLATGGTISMRTENGIRKPAYDMDEVFSLSDQNLHKNFMIRGLNAFNMDSSQMDYSHVRELAIVITYLGRHLRVPHIGFLVLHGTDTMSYTSAAMSLMMGQGLPFSIVYTGSQRPVDDPINDVGSNLRNALYLLDALHAKDMAEVIVIMGERAVLATSAEKVDDTSVNAFDAPRHRHVAHFGRLEYPVKIANWLNSRRQVAFEPTIWHGNFSHTLVIHSVLGLNPDMATQQILMSEIRAVVLYSFGTGTVYEGIVDSVLPVASQHNIPVFVVNPVNNDYHIDYMSSYRAVQMGAVPLDMTLSAALGKIEIALRLHPGDAKAMARFMTTNYVGEIPSRESRFSPRE